MSLFSWLLNYSTREEMAGVRLDDTRPWIVPATRDAAAWLRALPTLLPVGGFVYFEDFTDRVFWSWAQAHAVPAPLKIARGTIWPKADVIHLPLDAVLLEEAAGIIDRNRVALPSIHVHAHDGTKVILEWHDAFVDHPMYVHSEIPRETVDAFAARLNVGPVSHDDALA